MRLYAVAGICLLLVWAAVCGPAAVYGPNPGGSRPAKPGPVFGVGRFLDLRRENNSTIELPGQPEESKLINETDIGPFVASALTSALANSGRPVVQFDDVPPDTVNYIATGKVLELTRQGITLQLHVTHGGMVLLDRRYTGEIRGLDNPNARLTQDQIMRILTQAYQDLMRRVLHDIQRVAR
jgi:hypothetical protein